MPSLTPIGPIVLINPNAANDQYEPTVVRLAGGGQAVAWVDFSASLIRYSVFNAQGVAVVQDLQAPANGTFEKRSPDLAPLADGGFILTWQVLDPNGGYDVAYQRFDGLGRKVDGEQIVELSILSQTNPKVEGLPDGGWIIGWQEEGINDAIRLRQFRSDGLGAGPIFQANTSTGQFSFPEVRYYQEPDVDAEFAVSWVSQQNGQILLRRFGIDGQPIGGEVVIGPVAPSAPLGPAMINYLDDSLGIVRVRPGTNGGPDQLVLTGLTTGNVATEVVVADLPNGMMGGASITALPAGALVISWIQNNPVGADPLLARAYDAATLTPFGAAFTVADSARYKISESVAPLPADRVIFTYDGSGPGDSQGVFSRTFELVDFGNVPTERADELTGTAAANQIEGLGGNDAIFGNDGGDTLNGGAGNDRLFGGTGGDAMNGGDGNDFGLFDNLLDSFIGGAGTDTAGVQGNFIGTLGIDATTEVVLVAAGDDTRFGDYANNSYDYNITLPALNLAPGQQLDFILTGLRAGEDTILDTTNVSGALRIFGGAGALTVNAGNGSDGALFGNPAVFNPANVLNLGGNIDTLAFRGNYVGNNALSLTAAQLGGVDVIGLLSGHINPYGGFIDTNGFDYNITLPSGFLNPNGTIDINANTLRANESVDANASALQVGSVRFFLGAGDDNVLGSAGADLIFGNLGADILNGGPGGDIYVYRNVLDSTASSQDNVTFGAGDRFDLSFIDAILGTPAVNDPFTFIGTAAFGNVAGQLRLGLNVVQGDIDGDGIADLVIGFTGTPPIESDFTL